MLPNENGFFGQFGGAYVPEVLQPILKELETQYLKLKEDDSFRQELYDLQKYYVGRPSPLYFAKRLTEEMGGGKIYLKREDLNHTGSHKINNTIGQVLLAKKMGKKRIIAETGAGQHGVATATACALFGLQCIVYMGEEDTRRQSLNVFRMKLLGAEVVPVTRGTATLKDAVDVALEDLVKNASDTYYMLGSVVGPHPYPMIVRDFQAIIGEEVKEDILTLEGKLPDALVACVGGGSNAMGFFTAFLEDDVELIGVEPAGHGIETRQHAAPLCKGEVGTIHGFKCYLLANEQGEPRATHSVAAGLDYPGVGPEHSYLKASGRAQYVSITDQEALDAFAALSRIEGIIPALESAHAVAYGMKLAAELKQDEIVVINVSGRGDKDVQQVAGLMEI